jgi:hypothetical protein
MQLLVADEADLVLIGAQAILKDRPQRQRTAGSCSPLAARYYPV